MGKILFHNKPPFFEKIAPFGHFQRHSPASIRDKRFVPLPHQAKAFMGQRKHHGLFNDVQAIIRHSTVKANHPEDKANQKSETSKATSSIKFLNPKQPLYFKDGFFDLEEAISLITALLRIKNDPSVKLDSDKLILELIKPDGYQKVFSLLAKNDLLVAFKSIDDVVYQTSDSYRSVVELISNSFDAGDDAPQLNFSESGFQVSDTGCGMDLNKILTCLLIPKISSHANQTDHIGRFGMGFFTVLRHLKSSNDHIIVQTKSKNEAACKITFKKDKHRYLIKLERDLDISITGTKVNVCIDDLPNDEIRSNAIRHFEYTQYPKKLVIEDCEYSDKDLIVDKIMAFGSHQMKILKDEESFPGIAVRVGDVVVEKLYPIGSVGKDFFILGLPLEAGLSITRDGIIVDDNFYRFFSNWTKSITDISTLNLLGIWANKLDERSSKGNLLSLVRDQTRSVIDNLKEKNENLRIYCYSLALRNSLDQNDSTIIVHGLLYDEDFIVSLQTPPEFVSGFRSDKVTKTPVRLVLSPDLKIPFLFDHEQNIFYLSESVYSSGEKTMLSALFMINGLEYKISWGIKLHEMAAGIHKYQQVVLNEENEGLAKPTRALLNIKRILAVFKKDIESIGLPLHNSEKLSSLFIDHAVESGLIEAKYFNSMVWHTNSSHVGLFLFNEDSKDEGVFYAKNQFGKIIVPRKYYGFIWNKKRGDEVLISVVPTYNNNWTHYNEDGELADAPEIIDDSKPEEETSIDDWKNRFYPDQNELSKHIEDKEIRIEFLLSSKLGLYLISKNGLKGVVNVKGEIVLEPGSYSSIVAIELNDDDFLLKVKSNLVKSNRSIVKETGVLLSDGKTWFIPPSEKVCDDLSIKNDDGEKLSMPPIADLVHVGSDPELFEKFHKNLKLKMHPWLALRVTMDSSDEAWNILASDPNRSAFTGALLSPIFDTYIRLYRHATSTELKGILTLIKNYKQFCGTSKAALENFAKKCHQVAGSVGNLPNLVRRKKSDSVLSAIEKYLRGEEDVLTKNSPLKIESPASKSIRLANLITQLRLKKSTLEQAFDNTIDYNSEFDDRELKHAIYHMNAVNPMAFVREMLQNSLDAITMRGATTTDIDKNIKIETYQSESERLIISFQDFCGMTEEEILHLLLPGEGTKKASSTLLGGFGVGFYSILANANWVRLKTSANGDDIKLIDFEVKRSASGQIEDIFIKIEIIPNKEKFAGTLIETERHTEDINLLANMAYANVKDIAQFIDPEHHSIQLNTQKVNTKKIDFITSHDHYKLGKIEIYEGNQNKILVAGLPVCDLPESLWESIPAGIRRFYEQRPFYINLDRRHVHLSITRDRFKNHTEVMTYLGNVLPQLLIRGYLALLTRPDSNEVMSYLPDMYFHSDYNMASLDSIGSRILSDAKKINEGDIENVDLARYQHSQLGERRLIMLMTLIKFIPVSDGKTHLLLCPRDIFQLYQASLKGDKIAKKWMELIRASKETPTGFAHRFKRADETQGSVAVGKVQNLLAHTSLGSFLQPGKKYKSDHPAIPPAFNLYLAMTKLILEKLYKGPVVVGINTQEEFQDAYAQHYEEDDTYNLYFGTHEQTIQSFEIFSSYLMDPNEAKALQRLRVHLTTLLDELSHEVTHIVMGTRENEFTHDALFYNRQMNLLIQTKGVEFEIVKWFMEKRTEIKTKKNQKR